MTDKGMNLILERTEVSDRAFCPTCKRSVQVVYSSDTHVHRIGGHPAGALGVPRLVICEGSYHPIVFLPGLYAVVVIIQRAGLVLAVSRKDDMSDLGLPGGKAEPGEQPWDALVREVFEETGVRLKFGMYVYHRLDYAQRGDTKPTLPALCFLVGVEGFEGEPSQVEAGRVAWVPQEEIVADHCSFREYNRALFEAVGPLMRIQAQHDASLTASV